MEILLDLLSYVSATVLKFFPILLLGAGLAAFIQVFVDPDRMRDWLTKRSVISIPATVAFGAFTPFCACGTMAVIVAMLAGTMPWAPIMAFLTSSPLMSPTNFVLLYGVVGRGFAIAAAVASILVGLTAGYTTWFIDRKTNFLKDQLRFNQVPAMVKPCCPQTVEAAEESHNSSKSRVEPSLDSSCCGAAPDAVNKVKEPPKDSCGCAVDPLPSCCESTAVSTCAADSCGSQKANSGDDASTLSRILAMAKAMFQISIIRILPIFTIFTAIGFMVNRYVPSEIFTQWFGTQSLVGVPMAALVGLPLYVSGESAVPLIRSLLEAGVSPGAMLAFMIAGPGTSAAVIAGIAAIMKRRAITLYVGYILGASILFGYGYDAILRIAAM